MGRKKRAGRKLADDLAQLRVRMSELEKREIEQRNAQEALRKSQETFRIVADWTYDWEYWADPDGHVVYMSPSCERVTGYRPKEFMDDPDLLRRIVHPDDRWTSDQPSQTIQTATERAQEAHQEFRIIAHDGSEHWIDHISHPVFTEDGRFMGTRVSNRNITDRKQAENALRDSEERFRSIFEHSLDGILLGDLEGRVLNANPAACSMFGRTEKEICEIGLTGLVDQGDLEWSTFLEQENPLEKKRGERTLKRKDGTLFPAEISARVFRTSAGQRRVTSIVRDISERKKAESALRDKTRSLERSNTDLEQFAYVAAHDLREPLVGVAAYLKVLERHTGNALNEKSRAILSKAINTTVRMDFLIQSLLAYSRVTAEAEELAPTDLNWCLSQALANLRSAIKESGTTVTSDSLPILPVRQSQFIRVFQNLIGNAVKFRGTEPLKVHVSFRALASEYQFSVRDNGQGIEPPYVDRIFELFQRAHEPSELSGTGIGLASCKTIVERHGGRIWVDSEPGKGSTFHLSLPRN